MSDFFSSDELEQAAVYCNSYIQEEYGISDCLTIGVDFSATENGMLVVARRKNNEFYVLNTFRNEEALDLYHKLIGVRNEQKTVY